MGEGMEEKGCGREWGGKRRGGKRREEGRGIKIGLSLGPHCLLIRICLQLAHPNVQMQLYADIN
jgi:hypothetical protein